MPKKLSLRELTAEERGQIGRMSRSHTTPVHLVQRARGIQAMLEDTKLSEASAGRLVGYKIDLSDRCGSTGSTSGG